MILSEKGVRKIVREAFKISDERGRYASDDERFECNLDNLRNSSNDSVVGKLLFFLNRILYFNPVGVSNKSFLEKLDRFMLTGMTMTPLENDQYNQSIKSQIRDRKFKASLIDKIEASIDFMFFPSAAPVCKIINSFFPDAAEGRENKEKLEIDISKFKAALEASSRSMMKILNIEDKIGNQPHIQILYPGMYNAISKGESDESVLSSEKSKDDKRLSDKILYAPSMDVKALYYEIKSLSANTGISARNKIIFLNSIDRYFDDLIDRGHGKSVVAANQIRRKLIKMIEDSQANSNS